MTMNLVLTWRSLRLCLAAVVGSAALLACGGSDDVQPAPPTPVVPAPAPATPSSLTLSRIGGFTHTGGVGSAEITAYDSGSQRLFVINGALNTVDILSLANPAAPVQVGTLTTSAFGPGLAWQVPILWPSSTA